MDGHVTIVNYNSNGHSIVAAAGRISTTNGSADEIYQKSLNLDQEKNVNLIEKVLSSGHTSVLEHISLNLSFENVSVFVEQFMIEFRLASFTVKSRRYVDFGGAGYVTPDFAKYGEENAPAIAALYGDHMSYLFDTYNQMIEAGVPKEDARFVLPYCFHSNFYCTVNARELMHIMNEMVYGRGSDFPELVALGQSLFAQCEKDLPYLAQHKAAAYTPREPMNYTGQSCSKSNEDKLVTLISGPQAPEDVICRAALLKYGFANQTMDVEQKRAVVKETLASPRKRELEQINITFLFNRLSLAALTHVTRHRMQALVVPDLRRSCDYGQYVFPERVAAAGLTDCYRQAFAKTEIVVNQLLALGLNENDKVYLLLSGLTLPVMTTMNANELSVFLTLRTCLRSQWEIRIAATALLKELREHYPLLFSLYGPTCFMGGKCTEGRMTCGKQVEVAQVFGAETLVLDYFK